ncbi:flavodoxin [Methylomonas paludis]|uniref:Flavodoxin n=1 Tax=Methylomonas paludis TaxID=1173101 RepID=A0A975MQ36_9GAMM|nr:flavodoxin [Methylomonas paludis]QWF71441.1 flavodoxin [Methylomonas paludis]
MSKIGIFFGTDTGTTRLVAKKIFSQLGEELADKPKNINRTSPAELLQYDALILGTPSYGIGDLPGLVTGCQEAGWAEFAPYLDGVDLSGKRVALFGLGHQERYADRFASSLIHLYALFYGNGAKIIGRWSTDGYEFKHSAAIVDQQFVGLVIDQRSQPALTDGRIESWLSQITPQLLPQLAQAA